MVIWMGLFDAWRTRYYWDELRVEGIEYGEENGVFAINESVGVGKRRVRSTAFIVYGKLWTSFSLAP